MSSCDTSNYGKLASILSKNIPEIDKQMLDYIIGKLIHGYFDYNLIFRCSG